MKSKTCGRDPACDLIIEHPTVSRFHASIELAEDGLVWVRDEASSNGTFLQRCDTWIRINRAGLCIGDGIRFGEHAVDLQQLTSLFASEANVRLADRPFALQKKHIAAGEQAGLNDAGEPLRKPRRNPATGRIEEKPRA